MDFRPSGLDFGAFLTSQGSLVELFWGPTRPSWAPKCADFIGWTSSLIFLTFRLHSGLLNSTFWFFVLLAEHAGASVWAMKSALPDFGIDPSMVLSRHQIVKDVLLLFERFFSKKNIKLQPRSIQSRVRRQSLQEVASENVFFGL